MMHGIMLRGIPSPVDKLRMWPGLSSTRNARKVRQEPCILPGYVLLSGEAPDDSSILPYAPRERVETLYFKNVLVRADASLPEIQAAINRQILC